MKEYWAFIRSQWALLLFGFLCVFWGNFGQSFFIGWYGQAFKQSLGISAQQYGMTYSLATLASAACLMWLGGLIDRWRLSKFVLLISIGLALSCFLLSFAASLWMLALALFGVRLFGQGLFPHTGVTTMARYFEAHRGKAISLAVTGVSIGEVVLPLAAVFLINSIGWQQSWRLVALATPLLLLPLAYLLLRKANWQDTHLQVEHSQSQSSSGRSLLLKDQRFWFAAPTLLAMPFCLTAIFIHQDFILQQKQWSLDWMAMCFVLYGVMHWLSSIAFGVLVDKYSAKALLRVFTVPLLAALFLLANAEGGWVGLAFMALLGIGIGGSGPLGGALWAEVYGAAVIVEVRSAAGAMMVFSTSVSPVLVGWLIDHGYSVAEIFNALAVVFSAALLLLRFSYPRKL